MEKWQALQEACAVEEKIYLLFPAGRRITVFSQQVRALTLVEALRDQAWMHQVQTVAIVGGGISGVTAAMALHVAGLRDTLDITVFESRDQLIPLQSSCHDKVLAPHIIDWPKPGSGEGEADLPILGWKTGTAGEVAVELLRQFQRSGARTRTATKVTGISTDAQGVVLTYQNAGRDEQDRFEVVIVAAGFGLEEKPKGIISETPSYWRVIRERQVSLTGEGASRILISGLGDGGLIDFVLFAVPTLSHGRLCDSLLGSADVADLIDEIEEVEAQVWLAPADIDLDKKYYELRLGRIARDIIKPALVRKKSFTLLTKERVELARNASPLNRLAAAAVVYALRNFKDHDNSVEIVTGAKLEREDAGSVFVWTTTAGEHSERFDLAIVRHGDTQEAAWKFGNVEIDRKVEELRSKRRAATDRPETPLLEQNVADAIAKRAMRTLSTRVRISRNGNTIDWQGDVAADRVGKLWPLAQISIEIGFPPQADPDNLDLAICRFLGHFEAAASLRSPHFDRWIELFSRIVDRCGPGPQVPLRGNGIVNVQANRLTCTADIAAAQLNAAMNNGLLRLLDARMWEFINDDSQRLPVDVHSSIRGKVLGAWPVWVDAVLKKGDEDRDWILVLLGNLLHRRGGIDPWTRVRVGPRILDGEILPAVIYHLAMQTLLSDFGQAARQPNGNVARLTSPLAAAHFCGSKFTTGADGRAFEIELWEPRYPDVEFHPSALVLPNRIAAFIPAGSMTHISETPRILSREWARPPLVHASPALKRSLQNGEAEARNELMKMLTTAFPAI